jgi:four helix bundle protein
MNSYKDLEIYSLSYQLALKAHKMSLRLPTYELYETGSQLRRASKSITTNIVEGYGRKRYKSDFIKFLTYSQASCDETILHLKFINDLHFESDDELHALTKTYDELGKKIFNFIKYVEEKWNQKPVTHN